MSPRKSSSLPEIPANLTTVIIALIGVLGTVLTAYFTFRASSLPMELSIAATQTAEARLIGINVTPAIECIGYERVQDWDGAAGCYRQKIIANPNEFASYDNLARVYTTQGNYTAARAIANEMFQVSMSVEENAQAYERIGIAYLAEGDATTASDNFNAGLSGLPPGTSIEVSLSLWLAWAYQANSQAAEACTAFQRAADAAALIGDQSSLQSTQDGLAGCQ